MTREIFTIGYAGLALDPFIDDLQGARIECLIDIRELPNSRKQGFAKTALSNRLEAEGIAYQHFRVLGSPKSHRHRVRESKNYTEFFAAMARHLAQPEASDAITSVIDLAGRMRSCLMCYCPNWEQCHRKSVVDAIGQREPLRFSHIAHRESEIQIVHQDDFVARSSRAA